MDVEIVSGKHRANMIYREIQPGEYGQLKDFLYEAIFIPEGVTPPDRSIIELPELALYYENFGSGKADYCIVADDGGRVVGAVWTRIMNDYGHVDDETPSFAISLYDPLLHAADCVTLLLPLWRKVQVHARIRDED